MPRGLIAAILILLPLLWGWAARGLIWDVAAEPMRLGCPPWDGTEALSFAQARPVPEGVRVIDLTTNRQVLRGITSDNLDAGVVPIRDALLASADGADIVVVGVIGPTDAPLATRVLIRSRRAAETSALDAAAMVSRAMSLAATRVAQDPAAFQSFVDRRFSDRPTGDSAAPIDVAASGVMNLDQAAIRDVVAHAVGALRMSGLPIDDTVVTTVTRWRRGT